MSSKKPVKKVKHRKILRDTIQGITEPALRRICKTANVERHSGLIYAELRGVMKLKMEDVLQKSIIFTEHHRRKTVKVEDLSAALEISGIYLGAGENPNTKNTFQTYKSRQKTKKDPEETTKKSHRFKPGTVAMMDIKHQQKHSDTFFIPKTNFRRLTREIGQDFFDDLKYSKGFMEMFQLVIENYMIDLVGKAYMCSRFAKRKSIFPKDIYLVRSILGETS
jgi:histone H3/H4